MNPTWLCLSILLAVSIVGCVRPEPDPDTHTPARQSLSPAREASLALELQGNPEESPAPQPIVGISAADRAFIEGAAQAGMLMVESSQFLLERSASKPLCDFATMMVNDHGISNRALETLARTKKAILSVSLDLEHGAQIDELRELSGPQLDAKYLALQIAAHDEAIALFEAAARDGSDAELRSFANEGLAALRQHREQLDGLSPPR